MFPGDFDDDGDFDIVGIAQITNKISWFENIGENEFQEHIISEDFSGSMCQTIDFDKDDRLDIITCSGANDEVAIWIYRKKLIFNL